MKRTQLYLDDDLRKSLEIHSRQSGLSVSELVRQAVREKYMASGGNRRQAMAAWAGLWKNRKDLPSAEAYVRRLRKGTRLRRMAS